MKTRHFAPLLLVALLAACGQRSEQELLASAQKRMEQKDPAGAAIELKNLLQQKPDNAQGRLLLGKALLEAGDFAGAEIELRRAADLGTPRDEVTPPLAQTLLYSGQSRKLISEFADQPLSDPKASSLLFQHLAMAHLAQGNVAEARAAAARAQQLAPESDTAAIVGARVRLAAGQADEALDALNELLLRSPKNARAMQLKAELLLARGKADEAEPLLTEVLALEPNSFDARSLLVRLAFGRQQIDAAAKLVDGMPPAIAKQPRGRFLQAQLALAKNDAAKARDLALPLLKPMPNYVPLLRLAAGAHQQLGELAEAENLLNQAVKLASEDMGLRRQYASLLLQRRAPAKALDALRPQLDSGKADAETLLLAGKAQLMQGDYEAADRAFGAAAKLRPDDAKSQAALALSAIARDSAAPGGPSRAKADAALVQLRDLAAKDGSGNYDLMIVNALIRRQDLNGALAAIDKLAPKLKDSPVPGALQGRIHLMRKDTAAAQAAFEAAVKADAAYLPAVLGLVAIDLQAKRNDAALKRLEGFVAQQPHSAQGRLALAEMLLQTRAPMARVTEVLSTAVREEPNEAVLRLALIDHYLRLGNATAAATAAQEAAAAQPLNPDLLERLARTQLAAGDRAQAGKTYSRLTALAPARAYGWLGLAQLRFMDQDYAGAEREVKRALEAEPNSAIAQRLLLQLVLRQGRVDEALAGVRARQKKYPQEAFAYVLEADIELSRQHPDAAIALLRKAVALPQPGDSASRLMAQLLASKKRDEALAFESQWQSAHPEDLGFATSAADLLLARGELDGALVRYEALLKRAPDALPLINNVAWLRSKTGKAGARELAERGLELKPDYAPLRDTYATVLANEKAFDKAVSLQRQLIADQPNDHSFRFNLAQILIQSGDKAAAKIELDKLALLGPKFPRQKDVAALLKTL